MQTNMMMPANYNTLNTDEMTYLSGGLSNPINDAFTSLGVPALIVGAVSLINTLWGVNNTRNWVQNNKKNEGTSTGNVASMTVNGVDDIISYASKSIWNAVLTVYTGINLAVWWPLTAFAWLTA